MLLFCWCTATYRMRDTTHHVHTLPSSPRSTIPFFFPCTSPQHELSHTPITTAVPFGRTIYGIITPIVIGRIIQLHTCTQPCQIMRGSCSHHCHTHLSPPVLSISPCPHGSYHLVTYNSHSARCTHRPSPYVNTLWPPPTCHREPPVNQSSVQPMSHVHLS